MWSLTHYLKYNRQSSVMDIILNIIVVETCHRWPPNNILQIGEMFQDITISSNEMSFVIDKICSSLLLVKFEVVPQMVHLLILSAAKVVFYNRTFSFYFTNMLQCEWLLYLLYNNIFLAINVFFHPFQYSILNQSLSNEILNPYKQLTTDLLKTIAWTKNKIRIIFYWYRF
jgi:hypothetical protein